MSSIDDLLNELRLLDEALGNWNSGIGNAPGQRQAVGQAISSINILIIKLHRLRDEVTREAREWDRDHRPYDDRD